MTAAVDRRGAPAATPSSSWLDRWCRRAVLRHLGGLRAGRLRLEDGGLICLPGQGPTVAGTITVLHPGFWRLVLARGSLGAAEAYLRGWWRADDLVAVLRLFVRDMQAVDGLEEGAAQLAARLARVAHALRANTRAGSRRNIEDHYDLGNDFFRVFLDETLTYSCALFQPGCASLAEASVAKLDRLCRKLDLRPEHHLLEIGTGWGSMAIHAASRFGCRVTTTTISPAQYDLARQRVAAAGLQERVEVLCRDYRDLRGRYDRLVSVEMVEAVGHRYLADWFAACASLLRPDGVMAMQAITMPDHRYDRYRRNPDFIQRYVFPGSHCPSPGAMSAAMASASDLRLQHLESIGPHYATTLRLWRDAFLARRAEVRRLGYPPRFERLWEFYLAYCEAGFTEGYVDDVQMVLARPEARHVVRVPPLPRHDPDEFRLAREETGT